MPSVRIKKHSYSSLGNRSDASGNERPRSLANLFRRSPQDDIPFPSPSPPSVDRAQMHTVGRSHGRRLRTGSRVTDHLLRAPLLDEDRRRAQAQTLLQPDSRSSSDSNDAVAVVSPVDVLIQGEGERNDVELGRIDSALSLSHPFENEEEHHEDIVEHLDVIDPQVATAANLTNAANAILIPPLPFYSRKPVVSLSPPPLSTDSARPEEEKGTPPLEDSLDRHVEDVMRRRAKIRRTLRGVWSFLKTPLGVVTAIYGFLVVFWGAAIVFFLLKIINFHNANTQGFWVEVSSQVVNGLFTVTGIGLIPSRVLDTYRISRIYSYKRRTRELRAKAGLPQLLDEDDLPDPIYDPNYVHVLTDEEQKDLHRQQVKFHHHQTWYRPHGTATHRAFPIGYALLICCLNDGNSIFQIMLCGTMWGLNRFQRPAWSTGILIPMGFLCGIGSAVVIALGSSKTKRTKEVEERLKAALESNQEPEPGTEGDHTVIPRVSDTAATTNEGRSSGEKQLGSSSDQHNELSREIL